MDDLTFGLGLRRVRPRRDERQVDDGPRLRLARRIAEDRSWTDAATVSGWIVIAESRMNWRHVSAVRSLLRAAFPEDGRTARHWRRDPDRRQLALFFLSDSAQGSAVLHLAPRERVRRTASAVNVA